MPLDQTNWAAAAPTTETDPTTALLIRARGFVGRGWSRGAPARNAHGSAVEARSDKAVAWCMYGALVAVGVFDGDDWLPSAQSRLDAAIGGDALWAFNDEQETVEPVLAAFDRAIAGEPPR
jgi:hypothetical protein